MNKELNIVGLKHGVMIGGIGAIICFLLIMAGRDTYIGLYGMTTLSTAVVMVIVFGRRERRQNFDNVLPYLPAFTYSSIAFFLSYLMIQASHIAICQVIDPAIKGVILGQSMEAAEEVTRMTQKMFGMSESDIDQALDQSEADIKRSFMPISLLTNSWKSLLGALFLGAIAALFIKKSKPDFAPHE